jgi:hypothetical protein
MSVGGCVKRTPATDAGTLGAVGFQVMNFRALAFERF